MSQKRSKHTMKGLNKIILHPAFFPHFNVTVQSRVCSSWLIHSQFARHILYASAWGEGCRNLPNVRVCVCLVAVSESADKYSATVCLEQTRCCFKENKGLFSQLLPQLSSFSSCARKRGCMSETAG